jgi:hypothetical protein
MMLRELSFALITIQEEEEDLVRKSVAVVSKISLRAAVVVVWAHQIIIK